MLHDSSFGYGPLVMGGLLLAGKHFFLSNIVDERMITMSKFMEYIEKNKMKSMLVAIPLVPIFINYVLLTWHFPGVQNKDWLGFLSNYSGGIIGGIVAFLVANHQVKIQMEEQIKNEEEVKYINQLPTLINVKFELKKMRTNIENVYSLRYDLDEVNEKYAELEEFDVLINMDFINYEMEFLEIENWSSIHTIQDVDFQTSLLELRNNYEKISKALSFNFDEFEVELQSSMYGANGAKGKMLKSSKLIKERRIMEQAKEWAWIELKDKDYLRVVDDMLKLTEIMVKSIDEMMEKRHEIRDRI